MTVPQTEAGRTMLAALRKDFQPRTIGYLAFDTWIPLILAIEREAQGIPAIDVELRRIITDAVLDGGPYDTTQDMVDDIVDAIMARLASESSPVEEGAECPECGGAGGVLTDERGIAERDVCGSCNGSGRVPVEEGER